MTLRMLSCRLGNSAASPDPLLDRGRRFPASPLAAGGLSSFGATTVTKSTKPAFALLGTVKAIETAIANIHAVGQSLQADMHLVACSVLQHVGKHKDTRVLLKLINAMPEMARKNSLIQWFETFGNVKYSTETKAFLLIADKTVRLGNAVDKPFWKFKANEGAPYEPMDIAKYVEQQINKLAKDAKETGKDHSALINAMRAYKAGVTVESPNTVQ